MTSHQRANYSERASRRRKRRKKALIYLGSVGLIVWFPIANPFHSLVEWQVQLVGTEHMIDMFLWLGLLHIYALLLGTIGVIIIRHLWQQSDELTW